MSERERVEAEPAAPKQEPETLVLRGRPKPVIRFRRGLIVGVAGGAAAALIGLAWTALEPPSFELAVEAEAPEPAFVAAPDGLADAPASYADVPRLGPPLPGDLGRAILDRERQIEGSAPADEETLSADAELDSQRLAEHRLADQAEAARFSAVLVRLNSAAVTAQENRAAESLATQSGERLGLVAVAGTSAAQRRRIDLAGVPAGSADRHPAADPGSPWTLSAGTVIPASLITGINSDLPGIVLAQVTEQVRDSATGRTVLIPQGARLIGSYDSAVSFGQKRALVVWQRIVFPDGSSVELDDVPAADRSGYSGLQDEVDFHEGRLLSGIAVSSLLGIGTELSLTSDDGDIVGAIERAVQRDGARAGDRLVSRSLDVKPTLTIRPGWPVRAILRQDLVLKPWRG